MGKSLISMVLRYLMFIVLFSISMGAFATAYDGVSFWGVIGPLIRFVAVLTGAWHVWDRIRI